MTLDFSFIKILITTEKRKAARTIYLRYNDSFHYAVMQYEAYFVINAMQFQINKNLI